MSRYFIGSTDKNAVEYKCGETMRFKLSLTEDGRVIPCPLFKWSISGDDGAKIEGEVSGESGSLELETSVSVPGFVRVIVYPCGEDGKPLEGTDKFEGGAGAELEKITQGLPEPADYDAFWERAVAELDAVKPVVLEKVAVESPDPDYDVFDMKIAAVGSMPVSGYLSVPKAPGKYPAQLIFQGYGYNGASKSITKGRVTFHVNPHGIENGHEADFYEEMKKTIGAFGFEKGKNQSPDTCYFKNMILRDIQAVRYLRSLEVWNGSETYINGGSMGAMQSVATAAHTPDVTALNVNIPWLCDLGGITVGRLRGWRPDINPGVLYFDTANSAKHVTCPVTILQAGLGDYVCPPSGVTAMYNNLRVPKKITYVQNRMHGYTPPTYEQYTVSAVL